jgi:phage terminase small subunit
MPRRSAAARAMDGLVVHEPPPPVQPPATLSEPAHKVFLDLVSGCDPEHFQTSDVGLLCQYCEAQAMAERAVTEMQKGVGPPDPHWLAVWEKSTKMMKDLALRLRLGPQSRREKAKVERPLTWDERFRLEKFGKI